jgi:hypothetical protein
MNKLNFTWIDDHADRESTATTLATATGSLVNFIDVHNKQVEQEIDKVLIGPEPDLFILDHSLDQSISERLKTGSSVATIIHEKWPTCPIVSITGATIRNVDTRHRVAYEHMFPIGDISQYYSTIVAIALGFKRLKAIPNLSLDSILDSLSCPVDEREKIATVIPTSLKDNFNDKSLLSEWYHWFSTVFIDRPGFLYDELWASTFLGLSLEGFNKIELKFERAKYCGVFSDTSNVRYWKAGLLDVLGEVTGEVGLPWVIGRKLIDGDIHYSKCYAQQEDYPETVAAVDSTPDAEWHPMKLKHTVAHPIFEHLLYFEELRMMKAAD